MATIDVRTDMTGALLSIEVEVGQRVDEDDAIIVLESMKMHIPVVAPQAGTVTELSLPEVGDVVDEGRVIAKLET